MKISIKREQSQASLSFAERKKFRPKVKQKRLLLLLALLMTAATGALAQTSDKETPLTLQATADGWISISDPKVGMKYKVGNDEKQTITGTDYVTIDVNEGQTVQFFGNGTEITAYGVEQGSNYTQFNSSVKCYIYGNIMSLVDETGFAKATELTADYAFQLLFSGFRNLSNHPSRKLVLPAMTMTKECYYGMFYGSGLTEAPALPAQKLAERCYKNMFYGCASLTAAPELPATTLKKQCYYGMFQDCTSLTTAPLLPAPELAQQCYNWMFYGCTNLNAVTCLATDISAEYATYGWLNDVAATGTLTIAKGMEDKWAEKPTTYGIPSGWTTDVYGYKVKLADRTADADKWTATVGTSTTAEPLPVAGLSKGDAVTLKYNGRLKVKSVTATFEPDLIATPLTMEAITAGTIRVYINGELTTGLKYSVNGGTKKEIKTTTSIDGLKAGDKVQFYGNGINTQVYGDAEVRIQGSGDGFQTKVYGNIMSLLDEEGFATKTDLPNENVFYQLFDGNTTLIDASELLLPAATLTNACYHSMFLGCTNLTTAPKLPATTLAKRCYAGMFYGCTNLTTAPKLPATTLATSCYEAMFSYCTSLTTAPKLPATTLAAGCYYYMFNGCTSLTCAYVKAAYTEENDECDSMFTGCTATGAVLHTTPGSKEIWEAMMGSGTYWDNWSVADDWQD